MIIVYDLGYVSNCYPKNPEILENYISNSQNSCYINWRHLTTRNGLCIFFSLLILLFFIHYSESPNLQQVHLGVLAVECKKGKIDRVRSCTLALIPCANRRGCLWHLSISVTLKDSHGYSLLPIVMWKYFVHWSIWCRCTKICKKKQNWGVQASMQ